MFDEDGDDEQDGRCGNNPQLVLGTMGMLVGMLVLVRTVVAMLVVIVLMCHIFYFRFILFHGAKVGKRFCNSVAKCVVTVQEVSAFGKTESEHADADALYQCECLCTGCQSGPGGANVVDEQDVAAFQAFRVLYDKGAVDVVLTLAAG